MIDEAEYNIEQAKQRVRAEGIAQGREEGQREIIRTFLAAGVLSVEQIAQTLGLSSAEVCNLS